MADSVVIMETEHLAVHARDLNNKSKALSFGIQLLRTQVLAL